METWTTSKIVGRIMWVAGGVSGIYGAWILLQNPNIWFVVGGVAAMGIGNWIRHHNALG